MNSNQALAAPVVIAGEISGQCVCCGETEVLLNHISLASLRRFCPRSRRTYVDRGDGVFIPDGETLAASPVTAESAVKAPPRPEALLSDRPVRSDDKVRIELERATFA